MGHIETKCSHIDVAQKEGGADFHLQMEGLHRLKSPQGSVEGRRLMKVLYVQVIELKRRNSELRSVVWSALRGEA